MAKRRPKTRLPRVAVYAMSAKQLAAFVAAIDTVSAVALDLAAVCRDLKDTAEALARRARRTARVSEPAMPTLGVPIQPGTVDL